MTPRSPCTGYSRIVGRDQLERGRFWLGFKQPRWSWQSHPCNAPTGRALGVTSTGCQSTDAYLHFFFQAVIRNSAKGGPDGELINNPPARRLAMQLFAQAAMFHNPSRMFSHNGAIHNSVLKLSHAACSRSSNLRLLFVYLFFQHKTIQPPQLF